MPLTLTRHATELPMLHLSVKVGEPVIVGDPMKPLGFVTVTEIRRNQVRLAFTFNADVPVNREKAVKKRLQANAGVDPRHEAAV